jgi:hypothetical protein
MELETLHLYRSAARCFTFLDSVLMDLYPAYAKELYSDVVIIFRNSSFIPMLYGFYHMRQGLHVIASSWDYHRGAESQVSIRGNSVRFKSYPSW